MLCSVRVAVLAVAVTLQTSTADIISDITTSESDEFNALQIKAELFWKPILSAAEDIQMEKHLVLYARAEEVISSLPAENEYVRKTLREALDHLKSADDISFKQALAASETAQQKLDVRAGYSGGGFSFLSGGQNWLKTALTKFMGGGNYPEKLVQHVTERQEDILPVLRGSAGVTGNILSDCRLASKKGFDVRKYDLYNEGVPKTPQTAKDLANEIIDAAGQTRHHFTKAITDVVNGIARDKQEEHEDAAVTVTKASLRGLHHSVARAEASISVSKSKPTLAWGFSAQVGDGTSAHRARVSFDSQLIDL